MPDPRAAAPVGDAVRLPRWMFPLVTVVSLLLGATSIVRGTREVVTIADSDLTNFFLKSADSILRGDPWHMYAVRALGGYPNYNPPLSMFLLAPLLGLARALGFAANYGEQITFVTLPFIVLVPLMGYLGLRVMRALYPTAPETLRLLLYIFITLSPLTWQSYSIWYHVEQPLMLCFLLGAVLALQARREGLAGALAGLAFLTRTTALIPLIALAVVLLLTRAWRPLLKFGAVSALVAALGFAPFVLFDMADVKYTFLTWRGGAPIGSDSIWTLFAYTGTSSHLRELINALAKRLDMYTVMLVVAVVAFFAVRRLRLTLYARDVWALLAIAMLATPMLSKQVWPYYYLEPMVFIVVWELSTLQDRVAGVWRWPVLSISFTLVAATLSQYVGLQSVGRLDALFVGVTQTALMALFAFGVWKRIEARKPSVGSVDAPGSDVAGMQPMTPPGMAIAGGGLIASGQPAPASRPQQQANGISGAQGGQGAQWPVRQPGPYGQGQTPAAPAPARGAPAVSSEWPPLGPEPVIGATPPRGASPVRSGVPGGVPGGAPGAINPAGPNNSNNPVNPINPMWPSDAANAAPRSGAPAAPQPPEWRNPAYPAAMPPAAPAMPPRAPQGAPAQGPGPSAAQGPNREPPPEGSFDPWRDWPQRR